MTEPTAAPTPAEARLPHSPDLADPADSPSRGPAERSRAHVAWEQAEAHALAAAALLDDPSVPPWTAAEHLRRGFSALAQAAGVPHPEPAASLDPAALPWLPTPQALADALRHLATDDDATIPEPTLRRLGHALAIAVATAADARFAPGRRLERRRRLVRRVLMGVLVLVPVIVAAVLTVRDYREGPWRAAYYPTIDFQGEPLVRREGDVKFDWKRKGVTPELPDDGFSARYDVCMELPEDMEITFQLISDDGSRLLIDGEQVIDNWGRHGERSRGADVPLPAGMHHVRIEYFDDRHSAMLELRASLWGELPDQIPVRLLRHPGDDLDAEDPCANLP